MATVVVVVGRLDIDYVITTRVALRQSVCHNS